METPGVAVPNKLQVAAARAAPIFVSLSAISVTPAAAAAEAAATTGAFLAEIDVIVERRVECVGIELHVVACQHLSLPWFHSHTGATLEAYTDDCQHYQLAHEESSVIGRVDSANS